MDIKKFIGESTTYDKKLMLEINKPKSWLKTVSAFANGRGGKLIFGVSDNGELVGLKDYQKDSEEISELIKTKIDPIPYINLNIIKEDNKYFIILEVEIANEMPYFVVSSGGRIAYIRVGNESVPASSNDIKNLVLKGTNKTFDLLSSHISLDKASFTKLRAEYYQRTNKEFKDTDFLSFGLVDKFNILTNAGALFADEHLLLQSRVFCTR
ncbi:MAG: putative DNA binding domain-containing protein [Sphaerochaetaceae bacterium]|nr:putative DNA binding domain-containing protein [Sphaerochaetaceae bacterium]